MTALATEAPRNVADPMPETEAGKLLKLCRERIRDGLQYRKLIEPTWMMNLAFVAGQQWVVYDRRTRRLVDIRDVDARYRDVDLYVADIITEQRAAALGELQTDSDRPDLLAPSGGDEDVQDEDVAKQANRAIEYGWNHEWDGDGILLDVRRKTVDLGVAAIRCHYDPNVGKTLAPAPLDEEGNAITDGEKARAHVAGLAEQGQTAKFKQIQEGRICWETGSAFNLIVPPGVPHERDFPWECWVRPVLLDDVKAEYPNAAGMSADADIGSVLGVSSTLNNAQNNGQVANNGSPGRLRHHVWLYTLYERPSRRFPNGRTAVLGGSQLRLLKVENELPYRDAAGSACSGIVYFHWWRLTDRFWSRGLIESLKDPQRMTNRTATQSQEIIDRGMPFIMAEEGAYVEKPQGSPMEIRDFKKGMTAPPIVHPGIGPGPWMQSHRDQLMADAQHASTVSALKLGESPQNVNTYSGLALVQEQESAKRATIRSEHQQNVAKLVEFSLYDIERYWQDGKQMLVAGPNNRIQAEVFQKSSIPKSYVVEVAKGAPRPRSAAAQIQLIADISVAAERFGVVANDPNRWLRWLHESYDAGMVQPFPEPPQDEQDKLAAFENFLMLEQQEEPGVAEHDLSPVHVPIHRQALDKARVDGDIDGFQRVQRHIDLHIQAAANTTKAFRFIDPTDVTDMASDIALDEAQALNENRMILAGQPLNPEAVQEAFAAIQAGNDPETGQPLQEGADAHGLLIRASLKPTLVENLQLHLDRHGKVIKSDAFKQYPPDARHRFITHFDLTRDLWLSIPLMPTEVTAPKVTLSLRESVGPSTVSEVLRHGGVPEADPATIAAEPPLENLVSRQDPPAAPNPDEQGQHYAPRGPL